MLPADEEAFWIAASGAIDATVAMALVDAGGTLLRVSSRWCELTGWTPEEVLGQHWKMVVHPDDLGQALDAGRRAVRSEKVLRFESRVVNRHGGAVSIQSDVAPLRGPDGKVGSWLMVAVDATPYREATEALQRNERQLQVILDHTTDVVSIIDPSGQWRSSIAGTRRYDDPLEMVGGNPRALLHPDDRRAVTGEVQGLLDGDDGAQRRFEFRVRYPDGEERWLDTTGINLTADPVVGGVVLHSRDVTEQHLAADELRSMATRLQTLVSHLLDGVIMNDQDGRMLVVNDAAASLFGARPEELIGRSRRELQEDLRRLYGDFDASLARIGEIMAARAPVTGERVTLADGRVCARSFIPILDDQGEYRGHLWLFRDVDQEIAMASERDRLLEMEKAQNTRLLELDALKTDLVASVSHELRTPLTSIISFTHLLREGLDTDTRDDQREFLDIISRNTSRLLRLVDDLLLLDRLESNTLQLAIEPVDLVGLAEMSVASLNPMAEERGVSLELVSEDGAPIQGDVDRLGQLIDNLVANAVKFTLRGGSVRVSVAPVGRGWRLVVADDGIGIPADELDQLFQRFFRASNARREATSGSGLGLAIARRVAELQGGGITVDSEEGEGTTVTVTLGDVQGHGPGGHTDRNAVVVR